MIIKDLTLLLILLTFVFVDCDTQGVCNMTELKTSREWEPYTRRRIETYVSFAGRCYPYGCSRTRYRIVNDERLVTKTKTEVTQVCCFGYVETGTDRIKCEPFCVPPCKNGYCRAPDECGCHEGYVRDPHDTRNCLPTCAAGTCEHGTCVAPNTCLCGFGYLKSNGTCEPICTTPCNNGKCVAPELCECNVGYRKSDGNVCEPYCFSGCGNGTCVRPDTCRCNPGFRETNNTYQPCAPVCTDPCDNGTCVAPDTCLCFSGYEKSENNTCQPICSQGCDNGTCVAPETCRCNPGWTSNNTSNVCEPVCSDPCGNGTCNAPDTCECFPGYEWNSTCTPICAGGCTGGECVSPDVCRCKTGWEHKNGTCTPKCKYACGNGTCIRPDVCHCFTGYRLDILQLLGGHLKGALCIPSCVNCSGTCVAPNKCLIEATTEIKWEGDDYFNGSTIIDELITDGYNGTLNGTNDTAVLMNTSDEPGALASRWIEQHWPFITFPVLLIVLISVGVLIAFRWRFLRHYLKGDSYTVQGNIAEVHRTSSFVDVSFSALEKKDLMDAKY